MANSCSPSSSSGQVPSEYSGPWLAEESPPQAATTNAQAKQMDNVLPGTPNIPDKHLGGWWKNEKKTSAGFPDLSDIVSGRAPGRTNDDDITCFVNNIGLGLQFAAVGALIMDKVKSLGFGKELPGEWFTESVHP